ncbi:MAG: hypothetical protein L6R41_007742 [Letrouitia leprolyta]|nr:MAG: hypothetical protein L6R41_007742 [Letrouitia leprolyta]
MQSPSGNPELSNVVRICASIQHLIGEHLDLHPGIDEGDTLRLEVQTLHRFLVLIERVRAAKEPRLLIEEAHLRDVSTLLRRCDRALFVFHNALRHLVDVDSETSSQSQPWDLKAATFSVPRFYISFYTRTLQVSLTGFSL